MGKCSEAHLTMARLKCLNKSFQTTTSRFLKTIWNTDSYLLFYIQIRCRIIAIFWSIAVAFAMHHAVDWGLTLTRVQSWSIREHLWSALCQLIALRSQCIMVTTEVMLHSSDVRRSFYCRKNDRKNKGCILKIKPKHKTHIFPKRFAGFIPPSLLLV